MRKGLAELSVEITSREEIEFGESILMASRVVDISRGSTIEVAAVLGPNLLKGTALDGLSFAT